MYSTILEKDNKLVIGLSYVQGGYTHILIVSNPQYGSLSPGEYVRGDVAIEIYASKPIPFDEFEDFVDDLIRKFFTLNVKLKIKEFLADFKDPYHIHNHKINDLDVKIFKNPVIELSESDGYITYTIRDFNF